MSQRQTLVLLAALFALPLLAASVLYVWGWRPTRTMNHGELVQPARMIADLTLHTREGAALRFSELRGKWTLIYFAGSRCAEVCERNLYKMRQVRLAQGENAERVQRLFVLTGEGVPKELPSILPQHPGLQVVTGPGNGVRALAQQFALPAGTPLDGLERVYIVDPAGRLMMSYPPDADASGMRKDLARLLRVSRIG